MKTGKYMKTCWLIAMFLLFTGIATAQEASLKEAGVPCQRFVNHSDVAGGSTLGNILASSIPVKGVDMGNAILAMHSCRETGSVADHEYCVKAFTAFYGME